MECTYIIQCDVCLWYTSVGHTGCHCQRRRSNTNESSIFSFRTSTPRKRQKGLSWTQVWYDQRSTRSWQSQGPTETTTAAAHAHFIVALVGMRRVGNTNHGVMINGSHRLALIGKSSNSNQLRHFFRNFRTSTLEVKRSHPLEDMKNTFTRQKYARDYNSCHSRKTRVMRGEHRSRSAQWDMICFNGEIWLLCDCVFLATSFQAHIH